MDCIEIKGREDTLYFANILVLLEGNEFDLQLRRFGDLGGCSLMERLMKNI